MGMDRIGKLRPESLDPAQRDLYHSILHGPRGGRTNPVRLVDDDGCLEGPFNAFLLQPSVGNALQMLGATLRYDSTLPDRWREIAILVVAVHRASDFERYAHEPVARTLGVTAEQLMGIRTGHYGTLDDHEKVLVHAVREMLDDEDLSDSTFAELRSLLGDPQILELTALVGYYSLLALQLRVFRTPMPQDDR